MSDPTVYTNILNGRKATVTTEKDGFRRCQQRIEMTDTDTITITWKPRYNEACRLAVEWVNA